MMPCPELRAWLELAYFISQTAIVGIVAVAAYVAYRQYRQSVLTQLLLLLESESMRSARHELYLTKNYGAGSSSDYDKMAATISAGFDLVGHLARGKNRRFILKNWANAICWTHEALSGWLEGRRSRASNSYAAYTKLYEEARRHDQRVKHPLEQMGVGAAEPLERGGAEDRHP